MSLHIRSGGSLPVALLPELFEGVLLGLQLSLELSDFFPLQFDKGIQAAGLGVAFIG